LTATGAVTVGKGGHSNMTNAIVQGATKVEPLKEILHSILTFIYFLAHQIGLGIIKAIQPMFPQNAFPASIIDPLGFLVVLTLFMILAGVAKKIAWIIICAGWVLIFIRILMIVFKLG
jgi:hypothetical protein